MSNYTLNGTAIRLLPPNATFATGTLTLSGNANDAETVVIGSKTYTFKTALTPAANEVLIGASASDSCDNLIAAINGGAGAGTLYGTGTTASTEVSAAAGTGDTVDLTALVEGPAGVVATTETMTSGAFGAATLTASGSTASASPTLTSATAGVAIPFTTDQATVLLRSVRGSGTMTADIRLWGFNPIVQRWYSIGKLNGGTAIAEVATDTLAHAELVVGLRKFSRLYAEIVSLGGTGTEVEIWVDCLRAEAVSR